MDNIQEKTRVNYLHQPIQACAYHHLWYLLDWLYPPLCAGCNTPGYRYCPDCAASTILISGPICKICGQPVSSSSMDVCRACQEQHPMISKIRSWAIYDGSVREAILKMKFHQDFGISEYFGGKLCELLSNLDWKFDLIIPVPLNPFRKKTRGFNQSYRLALPVSYSFQVPIRENALFRTKNTTSQAELSKALRLTNLIGAFSADKKFVYNKNILLIDDIATTSSTLNQCSIALFEAGAHNVFGITVARAI